MVQELLYRYQTYNNGRLPDRIIYFRDGVSCGQFTQVLQNELRAIRKACSVINPNYMPAVTYIIVQKRHHVRLFLNEGDEVSIVISHLLS